MNQEMPTTPPRTKKCKRRQFAQVISQPKEKDKFEEKEMVKSRSVVKTS